MASSLNQQTGGDRHKTVGTRWVTTPAPIVSLDWLVTTHFSNKINTYRPSINLIGHRLQCRYRPDIT